MMTKLHIDGEKLTSTQPVSSNLLKNQPVNHSQQPRQQHDYSRFLYELQQKRKQRRLQQGPRPIHHQRNNFRVIDRNDQQQTRETSAQNLNNSLEKKKKIITGIVGSSIARNILIENIENGENEMRLRFKSGSDCADALAWLQSNEGQIFMRHVNQLVFALGTNDIHRVGADETVRRIDYTIAATRSLYPQVIIVWQLLQRRTRKTWLLPEGQAVLNESQRCNVQLLQLAAHRHFNTIQPDIPITDMCDGLHPTARGVRLMEATIHNYLNENQPNYYSPPSNVSPLYRFSVCPVPRMSIKF